MVHACLSESLCDYIHGSIVFPIEASLLCSFCLCFCEKNESNTREVKIYVILPTFYVEFVNYCAMYMLINEMIMTITIIPAMIILSFFIKLSLFKTCHIRLMFTSSFLLCSYLLILCLIKINFMLLRISE
jgi:hypothetical protein